MEEEVEEVVEEAEPIPCLGLRGLEQSVCRTKREITDAGEELPSCLPGERFTGVKRKYCQLRDSLKRRNPSKNTERRRTIQRARSGRFLESIKARQERFNAEADRRARTNLRQSHISTTEDRAQTLINRRTQFKIDAGARRYRRSHTDTSTLTNRARRASTRKVCRIGFSFTYDEEGNLVCSSTTKESLEAEKEAESEEGSSEESEE